VAFAWVHPSQANEATNRLLDDVATGASIVVPALWFSEVSNGLLVLRRRKKLTESDRKSALGTIAKLPVTVDEEAAKAAFGKTAELADQYGLTVYDATYLELAIRRNLPLASRDGALNSAAKKAGVKTW
jgi:predicted nucleic acid-binding protein